MTYQQGQHRESERNLYQEQHQVHRQGIGRKAQRRRRHVPARPGSGQILAHELPIRRETENPVAWRVPGGIAGRGPERARQGPQATGLRHCPSTAKQDAKQAEKLAAANTYETVAREFYQVKAQGWSEAHADKWLRMNELYLFPEIGPVPIASIRGKAVLDALRKVEAKGILSTAQDLQQMSGQVFRYAVQTDRIEQNPVPNLKGALKAHVAKHFAAVIEPVAVGGLLRAIDAVSAQLWQAFGMLAEGFCPSRSASKTVRRFRRSSPSSIVSNSSPHPIAVSLRAYLAGLQFNGGGLVCNRMGLT